MKNIQTVLKEIAKQVIESVPDYDINEGLSMQYDIPEEVFTAVVHSRGWDKIRSTHKLKNEQIARDTIQQLIEDTIETMLEN